MDDPAPETPVSDSTPTLAESAMEPAYGSIDAVKARNAELEQQLADIRATETRKAVTDAFTQAAHERGVTLNPQAVDAFHWDAFADGQAVNHAAIAAVLDLFQAAPKYDQGLGIGPQGHNGYSASRSVSLDARHRQ